MSQSPLKRGLCLHVGVHIVMRRGLTKPAARHWVGDLFLADISAPELVYQRLGLRVGPIFATADVAPVSRA